MSKILNVLKSIGMISTLALGACTRQPDRNIMQSFHDSLSPSNKEKYELLVNSTDNNLINSYLEEIMLVCSGNDTLSADVLLISHARTDNPLDLEHLEKTLYLELYKNPELLKFVFKQIGAYNRGTNKNILKVLLSHDQDTIDQDIIDQELKNEVK